MLEGCNPKLSPTDSLTGVKCRATSVAKKWFYEDLAKREAKFCSAAAMLAGSLRNENIIFVDELGVIVFVYNCQHLTSISVPCILFF